MTMIDMIDMTGQPDSDKDLQDAIDCITTVMIKHPTVLPLLTVHAGLIRRCLLELQRIRSLLKQARETREKAEKEAHNGREGT